MYLTYDRLATLINVVETTNSTEYQEGNKQLLAHFQEIMRNLPTNYGDYYDLYVNDHLIHDRC